MKIKNNKSILLFFSICFVLIIVTLFINQISLIGYVNNALNNNKPVNPYSSFTKPHEAIVEGLNIANDGKRDNSSYEYKEQLYVIEDDKNYIEFFISADKHTTWYFLLEKYNEKGTVKYKTNYYENHIELNTYNLETITDKYSYIVVNDKNDIEKYKPMNNHIIKFNITTKTGQEKLFLIVLSEKMKNNI